MTNPPRTAARVLDFVAGALAISPDILRSAGHAVDVVRDANGRAVAIVVTFSDGDRWELLATSPHGGPAVQELADGVTYISHGRRV